VIKSFAPQSRQSPLAVANRSLLSPAEAFTSQPRFPGITYLRFRVTQRKCGELLFVISSFKAAQMLRPFPLKTPVRSR